MRSTAPEQIRGMGKLERALAVFLGIGIVTLLIFQFSSLYIAPVHDSHLWWGDESWLMNEYREQMTSGVFRLPAAIASTVQVGNPFPFSAMWITSVLYGGVAKLFPHENLINVGRTVSAFLSIVLLTVMLLRTSKISLISALTAIGLLVACRSYLFASHCSRYDMISALAILLLMIYLDRWDTLSNRQVALLGACLGAGLMISLHVPVILSLPVAYCALRSVKAPARLGALVLPALSVIGVLYLGHYLTQPTLSTAKDVTYSVGDQPILHLFSKVIQRGNLNHKFGLLQDFAATIFLMLIIASFGLVKGSSEHRKRLVLWLLPLVGWYFLEGGPVSYLIYMLPCVAIASVIAIKEFPRKLRVGLTAASLFAVAFAINDAVSAKVVGSQISRELATAIAMADKSLGTDPVICMNPALSILQSDTERINYGVYTTHFVLLPQIPERSQTRPGWLLLFDRASTTSYTWEAEILRSEILTPSHILLGRFLDAGRSYFTHLDNIQDTLLLQRVDLNTFLQHYRR
jgi:hypothetical protein